MARHNCSALAYCSNQLGIFQCDCMEGFAGNGHNCEDIDECTLGVHNCPPTAKCINFAGAFRCSCVSGFHDGDDGCQDIDECSLGLHNCDAHTEGSCSNPL